MAVAHREEFAVVQVVNLAVNNHPVRPMALDTGLTRRCLRGRTHQRAPCYSYASLGELEFPVHCGGEADIRQVLPALAFQEGFACTPSKLPMGAETENRHRPPIAVIGPGIHQLIVHPKLCHKETSPP